MRFPLLAERGPAEKGGETIHAKSFETGWGGKGANQAMAAAIFSKDVLMVGCLGDDPAGHALYEKMKNKY